MNYIKQCFVVVVLLSAAAIVLGAGAPILAFGAADNPQLAKLKFVPWPKSVNLQHGELRLKGGARIACADPALLPLGKILSDEIALVCGLRLPVVQGSAAAGDIALSIDGALKDETYTCIVADMAAVAGADYTAVATGTATLLQALDVSKRKVTVPKLIIHDQPGLKYCGTMIDVARKPHSIATLQQCVEAARFYKIRYIHLHMSDENAWTFPSTKFPQLGKGNYAWAGGEKPPVYTVQELKDLVAYGDARGVTFVPELETPGHSAQLRGSLPEIFGYKTREGKVESPGFTDIASPEALAALDTLVGEFADVFKSSPYLHMGCDESGVGGIEKYPAVKAVMEKEKLANSTEVFTWYINQMAEMVRKRHKQIIVWQDAPVGPKTDKDVIVMAWREGSMAGPGYMAGGLRVIEAGSGTPLTRNQPLLLGFTSLHWQYPEELTIPHMRYAAPLANAPAWNPDANRERTELIRRQAMLEGTMDKLLGGFTVTTRGALDPTALNRLDPMFSGSTLTLTAEGVCAGGKVHYTLDETEPSAQSPVFDKPVRLTASALLKARWFSDDGKATMFPITRQYRHLTAVKHDAIGAKVTVSPKVTGVSPGILTDGLMAAGEAYNDPGWVIWYGGGEPKVITLQLKKPTPIRNIRGHYDAAGFGLVLPAKVEIAVSQDGAAFHTIATVDSATAWKHRGWFSAELPTVQTAQYVRLSATAGGEWTYVDEVIVNGEVPGPNFPHEAMGKPITATTPPLYKAPGLEALTDGTIGSTPQYQCLGFLGFGQSIVTDVTIDMQKVTDIRVAGGHFVQEIFAGVWIPAQMKVLVSDDGKEFREVGMAVHPQDKRGNALETLQVRLTGVKARYVRFKCAGGEWNIVDEFFVNPIKPDGKPPH